MEFLILSLLFLKHWYVDFVDQTDEEVKYKGVYGDYRGIKHSLKHGVLTFTIIVVFFFDFWLSFLLGVFDFVTHYHTDYVKMKFGNRDIKSKQFWNHLGMDQFVHNMVYVLIVMSISA